MSRHPAVACATEAASIAANTMRDRAFKSLPVVASRDTRALVGLLHADDLLAYVLQQINRTAQPEDQDDR
jgi:CBS domain-containing protein